jgi:DNA-binding transcriptional regulator YiaG
MPKMPKKFRTLVANTMSAESRARASARTQVMLRELHLKDLRRARDLSQAELAEKLNTTQPKISELEHRSDMYLSTLRKYVEGMGGTLIMLAQFPDHADVRIRTFEELADEDETVMV